MPTFFLTGQQRDCSLGPFFLRISLHLDPPAAVPREPETWAHGRGYQVVMGKAVQTQMAPAALPAALQRGGLARMLQVVNWKLRVAELGRKLTVTVRVSLSKRLNLLGFQLLRG